jgi:hypothetical protein
VSACGKPVYSYYIHIPRDHFAMRNRKPRKSRFINLAEHLALQNEIVSKTMDSMLANHPKQKGVDSPSVTAPVQSGNVESDNNNVDDAAVPASGPALPGPKSLRLKSRRSSGANV